MILTKSGMLSPFIAVMSGLRTTNRERPHLIQCIKNVIIDAIKQTRSATYAILVRFRLDRICYYTLLNIFIDITAAHLE